VAGDADAVRLGAAARVDAAGQRLAPSSPAAL
jgi:hypothetical protein